MCIKETKRSQGLKDTQHKSTVRLKETHKSLIKTERERITAVERHNRILGLERLHGTQQAVVFGECGENNKIKTER